MGARRWEQPLLVPKPLLHRGEPGGGGTRISPACVAQPEAERKQWQKRWQEAEVLAQPAAGKGRGNQESE